MKLGAFSVSLAVQNLATSKAFYEKLGFTVFGGSMERNSLIMKNGNALIGLFQGMFDKNMLTFNPGWDENADLIDGFTDVRHLQSELKSKGVNFESETNETSSGPGSFLIIDPDGNPILFDQHV